MTPARGRFRPAALAAAALLVLQVWGSLPDQPAARARVLARSVALPLGLRRAAGAGARLDRRGDLFAAYVAANTPAHASILLHVTPDPGRQAQPAWYWYRGNFLLAPRLVFLDGAPEAAPPGKPDYLAAYGEPRPDLPLRENRAIPGGTIGRIP